MDMAILGSDEGEGSHIDGITRGVRSVADALLSTGISTGCGSSGCSGYGMSGCSGPVGAPGSAL